MASYYLAPIGNNTQSSTSGAPLSAGTITTYAAGTTTPQATYTDNLGGTPQANPIGLNTYGLPSSPIWLTGGQSYKFLIKDSLGNTIRTVDNITGINDLSAIPTITEWVAFTGTLTFISTTSFSVTGDQTATLQVLRRLKTTNTGGTVYSNIATSVFSAGVTTVTVINTSGVLDSGLSALSYGVLSALNPSIPESTVAKALRATALGAIVDRAYVEYTANADIATLIPFDDTIPQVTEGTQILSASITPKSTTNRLRLRFQGCGSITTSADIMIAAFFVNGAANAVAAGWGAATPAGGSTAETVLEYEFVPGSTSAQIITVRVGPTSGTLRLNGATTARRLGGVTRATIVVEEIAV